ncbi:quinol dehydrogenase ferredoxin subunit NapH [Cytobacillus sp. IB215665]|uniref:quinol dehydrogenase ferredoxin subunit NapH n=1 Tax=Cytobacillus sp. IB215665 TaxID=3097357 RepID=UPI002A0DD941|nr:quinol dehydrogenase ferredoxin subunit NapH [Cytobacillus sp. IB215665]MDX8366852.1 quinol dehydrogenase ferredoxin subunit NapH [Cytobacillus sp. IB215665]
MRLKRKSYHKWTVVRRLVQFGILLLFLSPLFFVDIEGENFFFGSLSSSSFFGIVLSDPFATLQVMLASKTFHLTFIGSALIILLFYVLIRGRVFCSWVCPVNTMLDFIDKIRLIIQLPDKHMDRHLKVYLAGLILLLSLVISVPVFEVFSPIGFTMRNMLFTGGVGFWLLLFIMLFDLFISKRGWCRYICPLGGFYQAIGRVGMFRVKFDHDLCTGCDRCRQVCFADPDILEPAINREEQYVSAGDCSLCGMCVDHCPTNALIIAMRKNDDLKNEYWHDERMKA